MTSKKNLQWDSRFACGITPIDDEHRRLIRVNDALGQAVATGDAPGAARAASDLRRFAEDHFAAEAAFWNEVGERERQRIDSENREFLRLVDHLRADLIDAPLDYASLLHGFANAWLLFHILEGERLDRCGQRDRHDAGALDPVVAVALGRGHAPGAAQHRVA